MKASVNLILMDKDGKKILTRWRTVAVDGTVFMTTFGEDILFQEGDVLIGEIHLDSSSSS